MRVASAVFCLFIFIMIQMVDRPNTTPTGQDRESLTFKALLYLNVTVHAQVCRLFCVMYMPLLSLVQTRPRFRSSMWISWVAGISKILCTSEAASTTRTHMRMKDILPFWTNFSWFVSSWRIENASFLLAIRASQWRDVLSHPNLFFISVDKQEHEKSHS